MFAVPLIACFIAFLMLSGCSKDEGIGGCALLEGKVTVSLINANGSEVAQYNAPEERIYLIYGSNDSIYDDDSRTNYDGMFEFNYLNPGTYTVFAYSYCGTCLSQIQPIFETIKIEKGDKKVTLPTLNIKKLEDNNTYTASITGTVFAQNYNNFCILDISDSTKYAVPDERVYLINLAEADSIYDDDTRTNFNGMYKFNNLSAGNYLVYAYSNCFSDVGSSQSAIFSTVSIPANNSLVTASDLLLRK